MTDDLYDRLRAADPVPSTMSVESADSRHTRALMEAAMSQEHNAEPSTTAQRSRLVPAAIAASAAGVILAGALLVPDMLSDDEPAVATTTMALDMPATDPAMQSCIALSAEELRRMPVAFAGTATAVTDDTVTLTVDDWYRGGGEAGQVMLTTPPAAPVALLGYGIEFEQGGSYLITATEGTVNICGFSGEASPELQAAFDEAYGG